MAEMEKKKRQRSCIACGKQDTKGALYRIVRNADGTASFDPSGRGAGRGAYVCSAECFAAARKGGKVSRALRCKLDEESYDQIAADLDQALREA